MEVFGLLIACLIALAIIWLIIEVLIWSACIWEPIVLWTTGFVASAVNTIVTLSIAFLGWLAILAAPHVEQAVTVIIVAVVGFILNKIISGISVDAILHLIF